VTAQPSNRDSIDNLSLLEAAELVAKTGKQRVVRKGRTTLAVLVPHKAPVGAHGRSQAAPTGKPKRPRRKTGILKPDDPIFNLIGIGDSGIEGGISGRKYEYMAKHMRHT
jgi:hypothetical protein